MGRLAQASVLGLLLASCQSGLYSWGPYEDGVYELCTDFPNTSPNEVLGELDEHIASLSEKDQSPPPGVHAQAGYLEYLLGNREAAKRHFVREKTLYPESQVFMDGLLRRMERP